MRGDEVGPAKRGAALGRRALDGAGGGSHGGPCKGKFVVLAYTRAMNRPLLLITGLVGPYSLASPPCAGSFQRVPVSRFSRGSRLAPLHRRQARDPLAHHSARPVRLRLVPKQAQSARPASREASPRCSGRAKKLGWLGISYDGQKVASLTDANCSPRRRTAASGEARTAGRSQKASDEARPK
jgi:hypothetical protein